MTDHVPPRVIASKAVATAEVSMCAPVFEAGIWTCEVLVKRGSLKKLKVHAEDPFSALGFAIKLANQIIAGETGRSQPQGRYGPGVPEGVVRGWSLTFQSGL